MRRPSRSQALVGLLVAVMLATPAAALSIPEQSRTPQVTTNESVAPGEQLAGVVGVGQAELDGAVEGRALAQSIAAADSNRSKAAVVADHVTDLQSRLDDLEDRRAELQTARETGDIDRGVYQARTATLAARTQQVEHQLNWSRQTAVALPEQARTAAGVNVSAIERLRTQAGELRGGAVGDIARGMVGPGVGSGMPDRLGGGPPAGMPGNQTSDPGPPGSSGSPGDNGNDRRKQGVEFGSSGDTESWFSLTGSLVEANDSYGLQVRPTDYALVANNRIRDNAQSSGNAELSIQTDSNREPSYTLVTGNHVQSDNQYGIDERNGTGPSLVTSNIVTGSYSTGINSTHSDSVVGNNLVV